MSSKKPQLPNYEKAQEHKDVTYDKLQKDADKKLASFSELLDSISSLEDKKKALWKNIYENAVTDRNNAYLCFVDLYKDVHGNPMNHGIHGQTLSKYLERMEKATNQLLKLSELLSQLDVDKEPGGNDNPGSLYDTIGKGNFG